MIFQVLIRGGPSKSCPLHPKWHSSARSTPLLCPSAGGTEGRMPNAHLGQGLLLAGQKSMKQGSQARSVGCRWPHSSTNLSWAPAPTSSLITRTSPLFPRPPVKTSSRWRSESFLSITINRKAVSQLLSLISISNASTWLFGNFEVFFYYKEVKNQE